MASFEQIRSRTTSNHLEVLRAARDGRHLKNWMPKSYRTVLRWGGVIDGKLTELGKRLLESFDPPARTAIGDGEETPATWFDSVAAS